MPRIELIVGLGNPGREYAHTRHNAGFWFVDAVAQAHGASFRTEHRFHAEIAKFTLTSPPVRECWLLKPHTFMNKSGQAVAGLAAFHKMAAENILVVHDDLDLAAGSVRLKQGGGHGGHNGLRDLIALVGADFIRLRIGIGHPGKGRDVEGYVLQRAPAVEQKLLDDALADALAALPLIMNGELEKAMQQLHTSKLQPDLE
ncbi:MAG: aminoacyl-tRNA hydrolase [Gammaproteobacteria bacterium]|nr:aminoacyl-tRNA hydrolase [Gammaproteobacteria bacterium]